MRRTLTLGGRSIAPERDYQAEYEEAMHDYYKTVQELNSEADSIINDTSMSDDEKLQALKVQKAYTTEMMNGFNERFAEIQQSAAEHYAEEGYTGEAFDSSQQYGSDYSGDYDFESGQYESVSSSDYDFEPGQLENDNSADYDLDPDQYMSQNEDMESFSYDFDSGQNNGGELNSEEDNIWDLNKGYQEPESKSSLDQSDSSEEQSDEYSY